MAKCELLLPYLMRWEGGYVNDPHDRGGATNKGVTIATWRKVGYDINGDGNIDVVDLQELSDYDVLTRVLKPHYWDRWQADDIISQSVANILVDWVWGSGAYGIKIPQRLLGVEIDGIVGPQTLAAVNAQEPRELFMRLKQERADFLHRIVDNNPTQKRFIRGWMNRLNDLTFTDREDKTKTPPSDDRTSSSG